MNTSEELEKLIKIVESGEYGPPKCNMDHLKCKKLKPEVLKKLTEAAEGGNAEAQFELGDRYLRELGLEGNRQLAENYLKMAADQNHAKALYGLYVINSQKSPPVRYEYDEFFGTQIAIADESADPSFIEPSKLLLKSAELGCPEAQGMIGSDYLYKTVRHGEDGSEVVLKSVEKGDCDVGEIEKGWEWKLKAANNGSVFAQIALAERYEEGIHLPQPDMEKAIRWYKKAARKSPVAQYRLGIIYNEGKGVKQDKSMAAKYFIKATKSSYCGPEAQYRLGLLYVNGEGVERDMTKAVTLFLESVVSESYAPAQYELGYCYYKGMGVKQDDAKAMKWWLKAAEQGYSQAIKVVLNSYAMGDLGEKDEAKAACWQRAISSWSDTVI